MSTGIVKIYTSEGFVIAADGRLRMIADDGTATIRSESAQKLFPIKEREKASVAYVLTGAVGSPLADGDFQFDFNAEASKATEAMAERKRANN